MPFIIAIDGPAGGGKGTLAKGIADRLKITNIDTGAMYRCIALEIINANIKLDEIDKISEMLDNIDIQLTEKDGEQLVLLNNKDVTREIRTKEINEIVSQVSHIPVVREKTAEKQRKMGQDKDIVMEGRDIGTNVFPNANLKIYLDASAEKRAERRFKQNEEKGIHIPLEEILENIIKRDENDKTSDVAPLKQAEDAIYIDSTEMTVEEVENEVVRLIEEKKKEETKKIEKVEKIEEQEQDIEKKSNEKPKKDSHKKSKKKDSTWKIIQREIVRYILIGFYKLVYRVKVEGKENVPQEGAFILCGNHVDFIKVPIIVLFTPRKDLNFIAKSELFDNKVLAWLGYLFDVIPVKRGKQDVESMKKSLKVLASGRVLGLFPEGTRNGLQKKVKVKNGAAFMALKTGSKVVPVGIRIKKQGPFSKVILNYGKPLDYTDKKSKMPEKELLEATTTEIMDTIIELMGGDGE